MRGLSAIALAAEDKILSALKEGAFDNLPGAGKALPPDECASLPPEARLAYTILRNSGHLAPGNSAPGAEPLPCLSAPTPPSWRSGLSPRRLAFLLERARLARRRI